MVVELALRMAEMKVDVKVFWLVVDSVDQKVE
jgi:hypothetical protein